MAVNEDFAQGFDTDAELACDRANAWIARFAPLVMDDAALPERQVRARLSLVGALAGEAGEVRRALQELGDGVDYELQATLNRAIDQLPSIEEGLRSQLGLLKPGDPASHADLDALNARLSERAARQEMGLSGQDVPAVLEVRTSPANWAAASGLGVFAFAWLSFTTFHAIFMIGGMMQAVGLWALALLGFYALFFGAGFAVAAAAAQAASDESIVLDGRTLTIRRKLGRWERNRTYTLPATAKATIVKMNVVRVGTENAVTPAVVVVDVNGKQVSFGGGQTPDQRRDLLNRVNAYLRVTPAEG